MLRLRASKNGLASMAVALALSTLVAPSHAAQGVFPTEFIVGTHLDLSGPLSSWGTALHNGTKMALDEANAAGGVTGRTVHLIAIDDQYEPERAVDAVRELVGSHQVFAILNPLGTPTVEAALTEALDRDIPYLFPLVADDRLSELRAPLFFSLTLTNEEAISTGLRRVLELRRGAKVGVLAGGNAFGRAVHAGAELELATTGQKLAAAVTYADSASDFSIPLGWLRERGVEIVVLGSVVQETIAIMQTARFMRWRPAFFCPSSCYNPELAILGGANVDGLYAVDQNPIPYAEDPTLRDWARRYESLYGLAATKQALTGYRSARLFLDALARSGRVPTSASLRHALESTRSWTDADLGGLPIAFSPEDHSGQQGVFLAQMRSGRWVIIPNQNPLRL